MSSSIAIRLVLVVVAALVTSRLGVLARHAARTAARREGAREGEADVLLRIRPHHKGRDVADLAPDADVALANENPRMVDRLRQTLLEHLGLQATLHKLGARKPEHKIELALRVQQQAVTNHAAQERVAVEDAVLVLLVL